MKIRVGGLSLQNVAESLKKMNLVCNTPKEVIIIGYLQGTFENCSLSLEQMQEAIVDYELKLKA